MEEKVGERKLHNWPTTTPTAASELQPKIEFIDIEQRGEVSTALRKLVFLFIATLKLT